MRALITILVAILIYTDIYAYEAEEVDYVAMSLEELMNVKITTASRSSQSINDLPFSIILVTADDIKRNNYNSLVEILKEQAGFRTAMATNAVEVETFMMRGLRGNQYAKILIDGVSIKPYATLGVSLSEQINLQQIDRIEIISGAASALYGADAMSGVINIVTKKIDKNLLNVKFDAGEKGYLATSIFAGAKLSDNFSASIFANFSKRDDHNLNPEYYFKDSTNIVGKLPSQSIGIGIKLMYAENFELSYSYAQTKDHSSLGQITEWYRYDHESLVWGDNTHLLSAKYSTQIEDWNFKSSLNYKNYCLSNESGFHFTWEKQKGYKYSASDEIEFEQLAIWSVDNNLEIVSGVNVQYLGALPKTNDMKVPFDKSEYRPFDKEIPTRDSLFGAFGFNPIVNTNASLFAQVMYAFDDFIFMVGGRFDNNSLYGNSLIPRFAMQYNLSEQTSLRASFSQAFKAPSPYLVYQSVASPSGQNGDSILYIGIPNPKAKPEDFTGLEIAFKQLITKDISIELIGFNNYLKNYLIEFPGPIDKKQYPLSVNDSAFSIPSNGGSSTLFGLDIILNAKNLWQEARLNSMLNLAYRTGNEILPNSKSIDIYRGVPTFWGKWSINFIPLEKLYIDINSIYSSKWNSTINTASSLFTDANPDFTEIDGYLTFDLNLSYQLLEQVSLSCKIVNLFNEKYGGLDAYPNFSGSLQYSPQYLRTIFLGTRIEL